MENYTNLKRLGKGAQGSVYLANHVDDPKTQYVLKKVECNDETEANKAFQEAMALQELKHPNICGYKEFFVTWDKDEAAMFVCIVMAYYPAGDLANLLLTKRKLKEPITELVLKKWLAQMIDALVFVHRKKVIHRDLKPSNIFLTSDLSISIGDFGVSTMLGEARTRTRTTVGSMNWMAPEVMERPYDERSDVWSLGCIVLECCTCPTMDQAEIAGALYDIKTSSKCLEETLQEVKKAGYTNELTEIIRKMLTKNFPQRPTAEELLQYPFVQQCMELLDTQESRKLLSMDNKQDKEKAFMKRTGSVTDPTEDCPNTNDPKKIGIWLKDNLQTKQTALAVSKILDLVRKNKRIPTEVRKTLIDVMRENSANHEIQDKAIETFSLGIFHHQK